LSYKPEVDGEKCIGCSECVGACPVNVYEIRVGKSVVVNPDECLGCESCIEACGEEAIIVTEI
jgi:NAD-dependent dihydropyrimidine dehydrogenase PreA subunit